MPNAKTATLPGLEFEHFDFNQADPYLAKLQVREAIAHGVNRQSIILRTVGQIQKGIQPLGSRMLVSTQKGYKGTNYAYSTSQSINLLKEAGFKKSSDGYFQPDYGPQKGQDLTFTIQSTSGNTIRSQTEQLFQAQMKAIGIKINIQNYDANTFFGTNLPNGTFQIAEFAWVTTPFVSGNQPIYCSYTNPSGCDENWNHAASGRWQADGRRVVRPEPEQGDHRLQRGRRDPLAEHGDLAALPEAAVLRLVQQPKGRPAQHLERGRHLERRRLVTQLVVNR